MSARPGIFNAAILAAAGVGSRFGGPDEPGPKQFLKLMERPIYQWPLLELCKHRDIDLVVVVTLKDMLPAVMSEVEALAISKTVLVVEGGASRQESVWRGLETLTELDPPPQMVLIHDAARPFLTGAMIDATISAVTSHGACTIGVPASDTIKRIDKDIVVETLDRQSLVLVQTPQAARLDWLVAAHKKAQAEGLATTDDAALLEAAGYPVSVVRGSPFNLKVTEPQDLVISEALAKVLLS